MTTISHSAPFAFPDAKVVVEGMFNSNNIDYISPQMYTFDFTCRILPKDLSCWEKSHMGNCHLMIKKGRIQRIILYLIRFHLWYHQIRYLKTTFSCFLQASDTLCSAIWLQELIFSVQLYLVFLLFQFSDLLLWLFWSLFNSLRKIRRQFHLQIAVNQYQNAWNKRYHLQKHVSYQLLLNFMIECFII